MDKTKRFRWRFVILVTLSVGIAVGLIIAALQTFFGVAVPTILGGVLGALIIAVILARSSE